MENLRREMAAKHIEIEDLAKLWQVHRNTASAKVNGKSPVTIEEAFKAQETYFPECTLTYLFSKPSKGKDETNKKENNNGHAPKPGRKTNASV